MMSVAKNPQELQRESKTMTLAKINCKIWYLISRTVSEDDAHRRPGRQCAALRCYTTIRQTSDRSNAGFLTWGDRGRYGCVQHAEICYRSRACGVHVKNIGWRRSVVHAVFRSYSGKGTKALFDLLEKNKGEVESLIRGGKGFVSYSLVRTTRGGVSVSVYEDQAGADESSRGGREWIAKNASKTGVARPTIWEGTVMLQLK